jgi:hypothetical protein
MSNYNLEGKSKKQEGKALSEIRNKIMRNWKENSIE